MRNNKRDYRKEYYLRKPNLNHEGKYDDAIVKVVNEFWRAQYRSPTIREIMRAVGSTSTSAIYGAVKRLALKNNWTIQREASQRGIIPSWVVKAIQRSIHS
jgi:SOS-response transcriptional repressor LexA